MKRLIVGAGVALGCLSLIACAHTTTSSSSSAAPRAAVGHATATHASAAVTAGDVAAFKVLVKRAEEASATGVRGSLGAARATDDSTLGKTSLVTVSASNKSTPTATKATGHMSGLNTTMLIRSGFMAKSSSGVSTATRKGHMHQLNTTMLIRSGFMAKSSSGAGATTRKGHMHQLNTTMLIRSGFMAKSSHGVSTGTRKGHMHQLNTTMLIRGGGLAINEDERDRPNRTSSSSSSGGSADSSGFAGRGNVGDPSPIQDSSSSRSFRRPVQHVTVRQINALRSFRSNGRLGGGRCLADGCH